MKNLFKLYIASLFVSFSVAACSSDKRSDNMDTTLVDSSTIAPVANANPIDTNAIDSAKKDTLKKL